MAIKNPKTLVIDASIAQASKENVLKHIPTACANFLNELYNLGHQSIFTRDIKAEWKKHESDFARSWYQKMLVKGRIQLVKELSHDDELRQEILGIVPDDVKLAVEKDLHLVEAAKMVDEIIASMDDKMRGHLGRAAQKVEKLTTIVWVNPTDKKENYLIWLREGAPADEFRMLGYQEET